MKAFIKSYRGRQWIYSIIVAIFSMLVSFGIITDVTSNQILLLISAILGLTASVVAAEEVKTNSKSNNREIEQEVQNYGEDDTIQYHTDDFGEYKG